MRLSVGPVLVTGFGPFRDVVDNPAAASMVIGLGVATERQEVTVERFGRRVLSPALADIDGACRDSVDDDARAAACVDATLPAEQLAQALQAELSDDAGGYVCNAWLYRVTRALVIPVGFVHLPPRGLAPERLRRAIAALVASGTARG